MFYFDELELVIFSILIKVISRLDIQGLIWALPNISRLCVSINVVEPQLSAKIPPYLIRKLKAKRFSWQQIRYTSNNDNSNDASA